MSDGGIIQLVVNPTPRPATVTLNGFTFTFVENSDLMEGPPPGEAGVRQFASIAYHMIKMLVLELEAQGLVKVTRPTDAKPEQPELNGAAGSALDDIDPTKV